MAGVEIHGEERALQKIFCDDFIFEIPPYQRPYSWTTDEAGELLDDLLDVLDGGDPKEADPYFLGSIVLAKERDDPDAEVIDGQQRLTTLTLLLSTLTEVLPENPASEAWNFIRQPPPGDHWQARGAAAQSPSTGQGVLSYPCSEEGGPTRSPSSRPRSVVRSRTQHSRKC